MPLRVNLHHEIQAQELARRRDPLRLGMLALLVIAVGFVIFYFVVFEQAHLVDGRYATLQSEWSKLQTKATAAKARETELNDQIKLGETLTKGVDNRFFWAPILDDVLHTIPREVQLNQMVAEIPPGAATPNNTLTISGVSSTMEPRKEAESLRTALSAKLGTKFKKVTSSFKSLDDGDQYVMLDGKRLPTALFTMEFQIQVREPVAAATPAPPRKAKASE